MSDQPQNQQDGAADENDPSLEVPIEDPARRENQEGGGNDDGGVGDHGDDDDDDDEDGELEDPLHHLPKYVLHRVDRLRELNSKRDAIMEDYLAERAALEKKYSALVSPLYQERHLIVRGELDELIAQAHANDEPGSDDAAAAADGEPLKGVPQFWLCAMMHNEVTGELITEDDVDCLEKLVDVTCVDQEDGKGFTLHFHFAPNDYFENAVLTKTYDVPNLLLPDEPLLKDVKGTKIDWKPGRSLTFRMIRKKQRGKGKHAGQVRTVEKKEEVESFFRWFEPPEMPPMDEMDEDEAARLEEIFDDDYEVAEAFRYQLIPQAVRYFTGEVGDDHVTLAMADGDGEAEETDD